LFLSLLLQLFVLVGPFYMQLTVDEAMARSDSSLMTALAIGFALLTIMMCAVEWLRSLVLVHFASLLNFRIGANLFHHMLRLPLAWFERRHVGDLISRFGSTLPIRNLLAEGAVAAAVDGLMALLTLTTLFLYSATLTLVVLAGFLITTGVRLATFRALRRREENTIVAAAREQSNFVETVRAIQSLKLYGMETDRERLWLDRQAEVIAERARLSRLQGLIRSASGTIQALELVLVVFLAGVAAMDGGFTTGMIFAFVAYRSQFVDKAGKLLESAIQYRMLDLHLDRIGDIALAEPESHLRSERSAAFQLGGGIEVRGVTYRYAETEAPVLSGLNLIVQQGEFVAIAGPSGGGKTTLLKVMLGLFVPEAGQVLVDGVPLTRIGRAEFRSRIGVVMQEDQLLTGTIGENISMFGAAFELPWIRECARAAGIDEEIAAMPMDYNTPVGDMGAALSGGQKQRILLARALYRKPRILFLDEGTSQLDVAKEREVNAALSALSITRIVIAHRPETIRSADRTVELREGRIVERRS
jgi:ATP-binding cassette subfamily B protein RaxB